LTPTQNRSIEVLASVDGGSSYVATGYNRAALELCTDQSSPPNYYYQTGMGAILINGRTVIGTSGNATSPGISGFLYIYNAATTNQKTFYCSTIYSANTSSGYVCLYESPFGNWGSTLINNAINAFRIQPSGGGDFATGRVSLYGIST
jgi:hypothetical protein